jgi:hypothetical protein
VDRENRMGSANIDKEPMLREKYMNSSTIKSRLKTIHCIRMQNSLYIIPSVL